MFRTDAELSVPGHLGNERLQVDSPARVLGMGCGLPYTRVVPVDILAVVRLQASAYWATSLSVFFSPLPPTMISGCGRLAGAGTQTVSASW